MTGWIVWSVRRLRAYAQSVQLGQRQQAPKLSGELGELARAMESMEERLAGREHIEHLVRALTHELKSPLTAISGAAELLRDDLPAADRETFARQIEDQSARLRLLVERLLELSKLEHRRSLDHHTRLDLADCARSCAAQARDRAAQKQIALDTTGLQAVSVEGEAELLALAIGNLLDNALDFAPAGSTVHVATHEEGDRAILIVRDAGPGVPPYALARLGERFYSTARPGDDPATPGRKGSGLGLAIVREVMKLHGGSVQFTPAEPGLCAELQLPRA